MRGTILGFDAQTGDGMISGDDGVRYPITKSSLGAGVFALRAGNDVDFELDNDDQAIGVYVITPKSTSSVTPGGSEKITASLLAFFLGGLGVHKFFLGTNSSGIIMLLISLVGWPLLFIPNFIVAAIGFIEGIIYISKTDEDFYNTYIINKRAWF